MPPRGRVMASVPPEPQELDTSLNTSLDTSKYADTETLSASPPPELLSPLSQAITLADVYTAGCVCSQRNFTYEGKRLAQQIDGPCDKCTCADPSPTLSAWGPNPSPVQPPPVPIPTKTKKPKLPYNHESAYSKRHHKFVFRHYVDTECYITQYRTNNTVARWRTVDSSVPQLGKGNVPDPYNAKITHYSDLEGHPSLRTCGPRLHRASASSGESSTGPRRPSEVQRTFNLAPVRERRMSLTDIQFTPPANQKKVAPIISSSDPYMSLPSTANFYASSSCFGRKVRRKSKSFSTVDFPKYDYSAHSVPADDQGRVSPIAFPVVPSKECTKSWTNPADFRRSSVRRAPSPDSSVATSSRSGSSVFRHTAAKYYRPGEQTLAQGQLLCGTTITRSIKPVVTREVKPSATPKPNLNALNCVTSRARQNIQPRVAVQR